MISFVEIFTYIDIPMIYQTHSRAFIHIHQEQKKHVASFQRDPQAGIVTDWVMERRGGRGKNHNRGGGCEWQGCVDCTLSKPSYTMEGGPAKIEEVCGQDVLPSIGDEAVAIPHLRGVGCGWLATQALDSF